MSDWHFLEEKPRAESVRVGDRDLRVGDRVTLRPRRRADIMDSVLAGRVATIESIECDYEDQVHLAVVIDDDPGRELGRERQTGHRFFFSPDEVEAVD